MSNVPFWDCPLSVELDKGALRFMTAGTIDITQRINGIPSLEMTLVRRSTKEADRWKEVTHDAELCMPGAHITLKMTTPAPRHSVVLFKGEVAVQGVTWNGPEPEIRVQALHPLHRLIGPPRSRVHRATSDEAMIRELIGTHAGRISVGGAEHEQMLQRQCTDWRWLRLRMHACGVWLFPHMDKVDCMAPALTGPATHKIVAEAGKSREAARVVDAEWRFDNSGMAPSIEASHWDVKTQHTAEWIKAHPRKIATGGLDPQHVKPASTHPWRLFSAVPLTTDEVRHLAEAKLLAQEAAAVQVRVVLRADAETVRYRLGDTVEFVGMGTHQTGRALISGLRHQWTHGSFFTTVFVGMDDPIPVDAAAKPNAPSMTVGVVAEYEPDKTHADQIRVALPELDNEIVLARLMKPTASGGFHFYPEPKEEVIVAFGDDPRHLWVLGSTNNPVNKAPNAGEAGAAQWKWKGWIVNDDEGHKVAGLQFDGQNVRIDGQDVHVDAKALHIEGENVHIAGKEDVAIAGKHIHLKKAE